MISSNTRRPTLNPASFHDAAAREIYAAWFRPIAIPAVAAGTRRHAPALDNKGEDRRDHIPGVLRHGFDD